MKYSVSAVSQETLMAEPSSLRGLDGKALKERWRTLYDTEPPDWVSRSLLFQAVAYRLQEKTLGGLKPSTRRVLQRVTRETAAGRSTSSGPRDVGLVIAAESL